MPDPLQSLSDGQCTRWRQQVTAQVLESLPPTWETRTEILASEFGLSPGYYEHSRGEPTAKKSSPTLSLSPLDCQINNNKYIYIYLKLK